MFFVHRDRFGSRVTASGILHTPGYLAPSPSDETALLPRDHDVRQRRRQPEAVGIRHPEGLGRLRLMFVAAASLERIRGRRKQIPLGRRVETRDPAVPGKCASLGEFE
jgi:hypothetical protein